MLVSFGYVAAYFAGVSVFPAASTLLYILFLCYFSYYFVFFNLFNFFQFKAGYSEAIPSLFRSGFFVGFFFVRLQVHCFIFYFLCYFSYYFVFFNLFNFFKFEAGYSNGLYQVYCFRGHGRSVLVATLGNANPTATQFATLNKEWRKSVY